jgi:Spx/MgsR family transcriptional regulator
MSCGAQEKSCWCTALPVLPPSAYDTQASCLCPACLAAQLDEGVVLYGIANCDTVKKARTWLTENGIAYAFWDYKKHGVPAEKLKHWLSLLGKEQLVNTRGTTWRGLADTDKAAVVDDASAHALMLANASVIKRPVVTWGNTYGMAVTSGFDAALWAQRTKI